MLIVFNKDVPGALGRIASYLGERGVNIGRLYLGRKKIGETALSLVQIDQAISAQEIAGLSAIQDVISAQQIKL
jgi:D-3-phosphoglycerate dehydrogenase